MTKKSAPLSVEILWDSVIAFACLVLISTGTLKLAAIAGNAQMLAGKSGIFPLISERVFFISVAVLEYLLVGILVSRRLPLTFKFGSLLWAASVFVVYHLWIQLLTEDHPSCGCLGRFTGGGQKIADQIAWGLSIALFCLAFLGFLFCLIYQPNKPTIGVTSFLRFWKLSKPSSFTRSTNIIFLVFLILATITNAGICATFYDIEVRVAQTNYAALARNTNGNTRMIETLIPGAWKARIVVGRHQWYLEHDFVGNALNSYHYDGTNVYHKTQPKKSEGRKKAADILKSSGMLRPEVLHSFNDENPSVLPLTVTPGGHPLDDFGANLSWLSFCSGDYLRNPERLVPLAGAEIRHIPWAFGFEDTTVTYEDDLGLPKRVDLKVSAKLLRKSAAHTSWIRARTSQELSAEMQQASRFSDGFIAARYEVTSTTNINGITFPTSFAYEQYVEGDGKRPLKTLGALGTVSSISITEILPVVLNDHENYAVVDYRFRSSSRLVDEISYGATNGRVRAVDDPVLQEIFSKRVKVSPADPLRKMQLTKYGFLTLLLTAPLLVNFWIWYSSKRKNKKLK